MAYSRARAAFGAAAATALLAIGTAVAATAGAGLPAVVQRVLDCRTTQGDAARLACYDQAVGELGRLLASGDLVIVDKERVATVKRQAFGFSLPSLSLFERNGSDKPQELDEIASVVARAYRQGDGRWTVELEDGAVWTQTDSTEHINRDPRPGSKVQIKKAALNSFMLKIDGQWAVRARRVR